MARVFNILIMKRKNIFFLLLIASALLYGQDNSVTVKLKDGREITGVKISGGIENYYISIMTDEGRVDLYTIDIKNIIVNDNKKLRSKRSKSDSHLNSRKKGLTSNKSKNTNFPSTYQIFLGGRSFNLLEMSSIIFGLSSVYFHFSSNKNYQLYNSSKDWDELQTLKDKVEFADQFKEISGR